MARLTYTTPLLLGVLALTACPGDDVPADTEGTTGDDTTSNGPTTTPPLTTTIDPDSGSDTADTTTGGPLCEPECPAGECCISGLCFDAPAPSCNPGCAATEMCMCPEGSDPCTCIAECVTCGTEGGTYDPCLDVECPDGSACVVDNAAEPTFGWCAVQGCGNDDCACPLPTEGTALNACADFSGDDGGGSCFLDCSDGTCPDGMLCRPLSGESVCVWGGEGIESDCCFSNGTPGCDDATCQATVCAADPFCCDTEWDQICADQVPAACPGLCPGAPDPEPQYGDCVNGGPCDAGLVCIGDQAGTFGWCGTINCADDTVCQPPPATGNAPAICAPINDTTDACILDCSMDQACPDGMGCFGGFVCVWELALPGYGNCGLDAIDCTGSDVCLNNADAMAMTPATWAVCGEPDCASTADCGSLVPTTGDAPVACADPAGMGGTNVCYLDCAGGETCPDGMSCTNGSWCAWPQGPVVFADDFQTGDFSMGWTLNNVDGLIPDPGVSFVNDAWIVDQPAPGEFLATSTSWYAPAGTSDDWLISPPIMLGANSRLYWVSSTIDPNYPDTLEVRISTATTAIADFEANPPLLVADPEAAEPTFHFVDLAPGYVNQQVYIAFRNTTFDGFLLTVDDVVVTNLP